MARRNQETVSLQEYFERLIVEHGHLHVSEREASQTALAAARAEIDRRLAALNELRDEVTKDRSQFVRVDVFDAKIEALSKDVRLLRDDTIAERGRRAAYTIVLGVLAVATPIVVQILLNRGR